MYLSQLAQYTLVNKEDGVSRDIVACKIWYAICLTWHTQDLRCGGRQQPSGQQTARHRYDNALCGSLFVMPHTDIPCDPHGDVQRNQEPGNTTLKWLYTVYNRWNQGIQSRCA